MGWTVFPAFTSMPGTDFKHLLAHSCLTEGRKRSILHGTAFSGTGKIYNMLLCQTNLQCHTHHALGPCMILQVVFHRLPPRGCLERMGSVCLCCALMEANHRDEIHGFATQDGAGLRHRHAIVRVVDVRANRFDSSGH